MSWTSIAVYVAVFGLWIGAVAGAWLFSSIFAWSAGLAYVLYDTWQLVYVARNTRYLLDEPKQRAGCGVVDAPTPLVVVIAARNEAMALPDTLDRLLAQVTAEDEILVVDDGSSDDTRAMLARRYGLDAPPGGRARSPIESSLSLLRRAGGGKARALNAALDMSTAEVVLTIDADTHVEPGALDAMRAAFATEPELVAACGVLTPVSQGGAVARLFRWFQTYEYVRAFIARIAWMRTGTLLLVSGAFAGFRRHALVEVGGFDPDCLVEDYEVIHRLHRYAHERGVDWRVRVVGAARAKTDVPGSLVAFLRQRRRWFAGFLQTQYWNRDMTANGRYGTLGRLMLPIKALDTLQPVYGLTAFVLLVGFLVTRNAHILVPVLAVIGTKIVVDLAFYLWWVRLYAHWIGEPLTGSRLRMAALAAIVEPFSFQLLRHTGAVLGWWACLRGQVTWNDESSEGAGGR